MQAVVIPSTSSSSSGAVVHFYTPGAIDTAATDYVHAAITLPAAGTTVVTTAITNPDVPRQITITGNAAGITGDVVIDGTNYNDQVITETIVAVDDSTTMGLKAFKTVTSITVPQRTTVGDTISIGVESFRIGLDTDISGGDAFVLHIYKEEAISGVGFSANRFTLGIPGTDYNVWADATNIETSCVQLTGGLEPNGTRNIGIVISAPSA